MKWHESLKLNSSTEEYIYVAWICWGIWNGSLHSMQWFSTLFLSEETSE